MRRLALVLVFAATATVGAQPRLAADLNGVGSGAPADAVLYDGRLFFAATNERVGRELWAFDPATGETELAADILPGSNVYNLRGSYPHSLAVFGDELFFGIVSETGWEFWGYRADTGEARFVSEIGPSLWFAPGSGEAGPGYLTPLDGRLYYVGYRSDVGSAVFAYDPATDAVTLAADVTPGAELGEPNDLTVYDGRLYFSAAPFGDGGPRELFAYDPATGQTEALAPADGFLRSPRELTVYDGRLYFAAGTPGNRTLWSTDGDGIDPALGATLFDVGPRFLVVYDDRLFFSGTVAGEADLPVLWATDGTTAAVVSPVLVRTEPVVYDGRLFFGSLDDAAGEELWGFDAATGQAALVVDLATSYPGASGYPDDLVVANGRLFFAATDDEVHGRELWVYDAASDGVELAADIESSDGSSPRSLTALGGRLYFSANAGDDARTELWSYDPAGGAAALVADIRPGADSRPSHLAVHEGALYFSADAGEIDGTDAGRELWTHDPATGETRLAADLAPGPEDGFPVDLVSYAGRLYFNARDGALGRELWAYDPATGQAEVVADVHPGPDSSRPASLTVAGDRLYFAADDGVHGTEVWVYDAATGLATLALDALPGAEGSDPQWLAAYAGELVVQAYGEAGTQPPPGLWFVDPASGATRFADLGAIPSPPPNGGLGRSTVLYDDRLVFAAYDAATLEIGLWAYDAATASAEALDAFEAVASIEIHLAYEGRLYATAWTSETGRELWAYDAADGSLELVGDIAPGSADSSPADLAVADGRLYFRATDGLRGDELWVYDGRGTVAADEPARAGRRLSAPSPNPTRDAARFTVEVAQATDVLVTVHDVLGRELARLHDGPLASGAHAFAVDAASLPSGLYLVRALGEGLREARTLTVVR